MFLHADSCSSCPWVFQDTLLPVLPETLIPIPAVPGCYQKLCILLQLFLSVPRNSESCSSFSRCSLGVTDTLLSVLAVPTRSQTSCFLFQLFLGVPRSSTSCPVVPSCSQKCRFLFQLFLGVTDTLLTVPSHIFPRLHLPAPAVPKLCCITYS